MPLVLPRSVTAVTPVGIDGDQCVPSRNGAVVQLECVFGGTAQAAGAVAQPEHGSGDASPDDDQVHETLGAGLFREILARNRRMADPCVPFGIHDPSRVASPRVFVVSCRFDEQDVSWMPHSGRFRVPSARGFGICSKQTASNANLGHRWGESNRVAGAA